MEEAAEPPNPLDDDMSWKGESDGENTNEMEMWASQESDRRLCFVKGNDNGEG